MDRLLRITFLAFLLLGMAAAFPAPRPSSAAAPEPYDHATHSHAAEPKWYGRSMGSRQARLGHTAGPAADGSAAAVAAG